MKKLSFFINALFNGDHQKGTDHWLGQRITSVAMLPFVALFFIFFLMNYGSGYEEVKNYFLNLKFKGNMNQSFNKKLVSFALISMFMMLSASYIMASGKVVLYSAH